MKEYFEPKIKARRFEELENISSLTVAGSLGDIDDSDSGEDTLDFGEILAKNGLSNN